MFDFIANIFGYLLNFLYIILNNYGFAIIIFSILVKLLLLPLTIKQQKTMEKTTKMQAELQALQFKYKNDPEKLNREMMDMYKRENISPFSGCLSGVAQIILILAVFYLVRSPLTYMKKVDSNIINEYTNKLETKTNYPEVEIIKEFGTENEELYVNMEFLGLDLSSIPTQDAQDFRAFIIPVIYVASSIVSMKMTMNMQNKGKDKKEEKDTSKDKEKQPESAEEIMQSTSKSMSYMMPVMAFSISLVAPLGLALYWLMSNVLMIVERLVLNIIKSKKEKKEELA